MNLPKKPTRRPKINPLRLKLKQTLQLRNRRRAPIHAINSLRRKPKLVDCDDTLRNDERQIGVFAGNQVVQRDAEGVSLGAAGNAGGAGGCGWTVGGGNEGGGGD